MKPYSKDFLTDLANLVRHGPEPFDRLISDLSDPDRRQALIDALGHVSSIASETVPTGRSLPRPNGPPSYSGITTPEIPDADPEIAPMLHAIRDKLTTAPALRSRRVMQDLVHQLNVPVAKRDSIPRMIQKILASLATRNVDEVAEALSRVKEADRGSTESFMDLASFITRSPTTSGQR